MGGRKELVGQFQWTFLPAGTRLDLAGWPLGVAGLIGLLDDDALGGWMGLGRSR
jgi:hypothetical protein